ncbi:DNA topoisomerase TopA [Actinomyces sp. oral taxon 448 str. F0400]|nr:DNA topoisomerase TopA [Actinomyces sp. oral taxon 448 str. F0400]
MIMSGRRTARRSGRTLDDLVRLACSTDPDEPVRRPRRAAVAPRAAILLGAVLIGLALLLALRTVLAAPGGPAAAGPVTSAGASGSGGSTVAASAPAEPGGGPGSAAAHTSAELVSGPSAGSSGTGGLLVHVAGAVGAPGVVSLPEGARVVDAIEAAGGAREDADTDQLNLARPVVDGEQVRVPVVGEVLEAASPGPQASSTASGGSGAGPINVNTATASELEALPGIGPALAERIVSHREANGPFKSLDDLTDVPGIGKAKLEALRTEATV